MASGGNGVRAFRGTEFASSGWRPRMYANTAVAKGNGLFSVASPSPFAVAISVSTPSSVGLSAPAKFPARFPNENSLSSSPPGCFKPSRPSSRTSALASPAATMQRYRAGTWSNGNNSLAHCAAISLRPFSAPAETVERALPCVSMEDNSKPSMAMATAPPHPLYARANDRAAPCTETRTASGSEASAPNTLDAISAVPVTSSGVRTLSCPRAW
mmetsp:Transcript_13245/g.49496  ORF Transcript_13245/g.49496 Transcript_13245/m.49496 type:complete len:214 (-) Transcript_13245:1693-2334(-)